MPGGRSSRRAGSSTGRSSRSGSTSTGYSTSRALARLHVPLAPVHDPARSTRGSSASRARCSRRRRISAARSFTTFTRVILPLAFPAIVAGSIFTFSLTLGDYIAPGLDHERAVHRNRDLQHPRRGAADRGGVSRRADRRHHRLPARGAQSFGRSSRSDGRVARLTRVLLRGGALLTLALHLRAAPASSRLYAFNENVTQAWPIENSRTKWFSVAYRQRGVRAAPEERRSSRRSARPRSPSLLGTLAAIAVSRYRFFGSEMITFAVILRSRSRGS